MRISSIHECKVCHEETYHENIAERGEQEKMQCKKCSHVDGLKFKATIVESLNNAN